MPVEGSGLMPLHGDPHGGNKPPVMAIPTPPASFQGEEVFDHALHGFHGMAARLAQTTVDGSIQDVTPLLAACRGPVTRLARCGASGHPTWSLKRGTSRVRIGCAVHAHRLNHPSSLPCCQPSAPGFMGAVASVLDGPQHTWVM
jgi:hypothetical protein